MLRSFRVHATTKVGVLAGHSWNGKKIPSNVAVHDAAEPHLDALRVNFDGVEPGLESASSWRLDEIDVHPGTLKYDAYFFEWRRSWNEAGHMIVNIPCVVFGGSVYKSEEIDAALSSMRRNIEIDDDLDGIRRHGDDQVPENVLVDAGDAENSDNVVYFDADKFAKEISSKIAITIADAIGTLGGVAHATASNQLSW